MVGYIVSPLRIENKNLDSKMYLLWGIIGHAKIYASKYQSVRNKKKSKYSKNQIIATLKLGSTK